jgi:hypothetical protein
MSSFWIGDFRFEPDVQNSGVIARAEQLAVKMEVELSVVKRSMILVRIMGLGYGAENLA